MALSFSAKIHIIGVNPYVFLPKKTLLEIFKQAEENKGAIPVKGTIEGQDFIQTLVLFKGKWRLYINGIMRKAAHVDVGDIVHISIMYDAASRKIPMHPAFKQALEKNKEAKRVFLTYPKSRQKEINRYLNNLKTEETLQKNINRIIRHLSGKEVEYSVLLRNK